MNVCPRCGITVRRKNNGCVGHQLVVPEKLQAINIGTLLEEKRVPSVVSLEVIAQAVMQADGLKRKDFCRKGKGGDQLVASRRAFIIIGLHLQHSQHDLSKFLKVSEAGVSKAKRRAEEELKVNPQVRRSVRRTVERLPSVLQQLQREYVHQAA